MHICTLIHTHYFHTKCGANYAFAFLRVVEYGDNLISDLATLSRSHQINRISLSVIFGTNDRRRYSISFHDRIARLPQVPRSLKLSVARLLNAIVFLSRVHRR